MDIPTLYERDDVPLDLRYCPAERGAHTVELDGGEGLEIQHDGAVPDERGEVVDVWEEVDIDAVPRLTKYM